MGVVMVVVGVVGVDVGPWVIVVGPLPGFVTGPEFRLSMSTSPEVSLET